VTIAYPLRSVAPMPPRAPSSPGCSTGVVVALPVGGAHPLDRLAGLSLALRAVLMLQSAGLQRIVLVTAEDDPATAASIAKDLRVRTAVDVVHGATWAALASVLDGPFVLVCHNIVADPAVCQRLCGMEPEQAPAVLAMADGRAAGMLLGTPALVARHLEEPLADAPAMLAADATVRQLDVSTAWHADVSTPSGRVRAFRQLFEACRKPVDGIVARRLNRHISIAISKQLVRAPITPNQVTVVTFLLGLAGAGAVALGGYCAMLLGAFLFQCNSILDGVDGELARVRFQQSKLGEWLDTVSDDASNLLFYAGIAVGARSLPYGPILVACAVVAIVASLLATVQYYVELVAVGSGDLYAIDWDFDQVPAVTPAHRLIVFLRRAVKKDFAISFFLVMALCGVLPYALPLVAGCAIGTLVAATRRNILKHRVRTA